MMTARFSSAKKYIVCCMALASLLVTGCSSPQQQSSLNFPRKPADSDGRKAGRAMLLYEQAEKDMDVNDSVIVIPPEEVEDTPGKPQEE